MAGVIYTLCTLTAFLCAWLLLQAYKHSRYKLLLWGGLCFAGLTLSNGVLVVDKLMLGPEIDLSIWRGFVSLTSVMILLYGLIWEKE